jgi:hypothetical protein
LVLALNDSVKWWFWSAGLLKLVGDTAQVTSPLVMKVCTSCLFFLFLFLIFVFSTANYHICRRIVLRPQIRASGPKHRQRHWTDICATCHANHWISLYATYVLPCCIHRRSPPWRPHHRDL